MNENGGFADPGLVSDLVRSVALPMPDPRLVKRARLLLLLGEAASPHLDGHGSELAAAVCQVAFANEDTGEEIKFEDVLAEAVEHRWHHAELYAGWRHVTLTRALRIFAACLLVWVKETT